MMIEEFTERTGISPVEASFRWKEIIRDYLAADVYDEFGLKLKGEHKNAFCLRWLLEQKRDISHCVRWLEENDPYDYSAWREVIDPNYIWQDPFDTAED